MSNQLFENLCPPQFQLSGLNVVLTAGDFELLNISAEDFRFVTREVTEDLSEASADIRSRSTMLRRLLSESDIFNIGHIYPPKGELRVQARMLEFEPVHPAFIVTCGDYPWANDRLPGAGIEFSFKDLPSVDECPWSYRENADVTLSEYLEGLAVTVLGVRIKRRQLIKYVADKKSAHVSSKRKHTYEHALDRAWASMSMIIKNSDGEFTRLNYVYMELLSIIDALRRSESINAYVRAVERWIGTAQITFPDDVSQEAGMFSVKPM